MDWRLERPSGDMVPQHKRRYASGLLQRCELKGPGSGRQWKRGRTPYFMPSILH